MLSVIPPDISLFTSLKSLRFSFLVDSVLGEVCEAFDATLGSLDHPPPTVFSLSYNIIIFEPGPSEDFKYFADLKYEPENIEKAIQALNWDALQTVVLGMTSHVKKLWIQLDTNCKAGEIPANLKRIITRKMPKLDANGLLGFGVDPNICEEWRFQITS